MIFAFDTETTGLPDFKARSADPGQPHVIQLALRYMTTRATNWNMIA